jgi:hypothetical protein
MEEWILGRRRKSILSQARRSAKHNCRRANSRKLRFETLRGPSIPCRDESMSPWRGVEGSVLRGHLLSRALLLEVDL